MGPVQKVVVALLLTAVIAPPFSGFYSFFSGVPLHLLAATKKEQEESSQSPARSSVSLVSGLAHTLAVPDEVAIALGIRKRQSDSVAIARPRPRCGHSCSPGRPASIPHGSTVSALDSRPPEWSSWPKFRIAHPRPDARSTAS